MGKKNKYELQNLANSMGEVVTPACEAENIEFVHAECVSGTNDTIVRLYLDKQGGITIDDLARMSRQIESLLDVYFDHLGKYRLEVSSPGLDRHLNKKDDFEKVIESRVKIKSDELIEKRKEFIGILKKVTNEGVTVVVDNKEFYIKFEQINKARLANY